MNMESGSCPLLGDSVHRKVVNSHTAAAAEGKEITPNDFWVSLGEVQVRRARVTENSDHLIPL